MHIVHCRCLNVPDTDDTATFRIWKIYRDLSIAILRVSTITISWVWLLWHLVIALSVLRLLHWRRRRSAVVLAGICLLSSSTASPCTASDDAEQNKENDDTANNCYWNRYPQIVAVPRGDGVLPVALDAIASSIASPAVSAGSALNEILAFQDDTRQRAARTLTSHLASIPTKTAASLRNPVGST
jgi:hypothetical protein